MFVLPKMIAEITFSLTVFLTPAEASQFCEDNAGKDYYVDNYSVHSMWDSEKSQPYKAVMITCERKEKGEK